MTPISKLVNEYAVKHGIKLIDINSATCAHLLDSKTCILKGAPALAESHLNEDRARQTFESLFKEYERMNQQHKRPSVRDISSLLDKRIRLEQERRNFTCDYSQALHFVMESARNGDKTDAEIIRMYVS